MYKNEERKAAKEVFECMVELIMMFKYTDGFCGIGKEYHRETEMGWYTLEEEVEKKVKKSRFELPKMVYENVSKLLMDILWTMPEDIYVENDVQTYRNLEQKETEFYEKLHECFVDYLK